MQNFSVAGLFFALRPGIIQPSEGKHGVQSEVIHLFLNPLRDSGYGEASPRVVCYNACVRVRVCAVRHDGCSPVLHTPCAAAAVWRFVKTRDCDCVSIRTFDQKLCTFFSMVQLDVNKNTHYCCGTCTVVCET